MKVVLIFFNDKKCNGETIFLRKSELRPEKQTTEKGFFFAVTKKVGVTADN